MIIIICYRKNAVFVCVRVCFIFVLLYYGNQLMLLLLQVMFDLIFHDYPQVV